MTDDQKKEFLSVLMKDYGVQIGKNDEILPILHIMYQLVFQYKGTVARQEETIKGFEKLLLEQKSNQEVTKEQAHHVNGYGMEGNQGTQKFLGIPVNLHSLILLNFFLILLLLTLAVIFLIIIL